MFRRALFVSVVSLVASACAPPKFIDVRPSLGVEPAQLHVFHSNRFEWLYYSGVLDTAEGKRLGVMFTVFQFVHPLTQSFFHPTLFVIVDPDTKQYFAQSEFGTSGPRVELGVPKIDTDVAHFALAPDGSMSISGTFAEDQPPLDFALTVADAQPPLLHGKDGIIQMGDGLESGYYSFPTLQPRGTVKVGDQRYTVTGGRLWMDHQWGNWTTAGMRWDWFSARFDDGGALMLFQFRDENDRVVPGNWTYRAADGTVRRGSAYQLEALRRHPNAHCGATYPVDWKIRIEELDLSLAVQPVFDGQCMKFGKIWEGLSTVSGTLGGAPATGHAFVELTGY